MIYILYYDHNGISVNQKSQYIVDQYKKRRRLFLGAGISAVVIIVLLVIGAVFQPLEVFFQMRTDRESNQHFTQAQPTPESFSQHEEQEDMARMWSNGKCEGKGSTKFKNSPIAVDNLSFIFPMGRMASAHVTPTDHQYWIPIGVKSTGGLTDEPEKFEIYAPADGYIVSIEHSTQAITEGSKQPPQDDYRIIFEHSCTFYSLLIHINKVKKEILDQITFKEDSPGHSSGFGRVGVKQAEVIGRSGAHQFDFAVINTEVTLHGFINPQSYNAEPWKIHTVDTFDYFDEPLRSQLTARSVRTTVPMGGKIDYDIPGKLVGNWFREGSGGYFGNTTDRGASGRYWDSHLSVVYDPIDPAKITVSTGNFNGTSAQFAVLGNSPDPKSVDEKSGVIKYELVERDYITSSGQVWDERMFDKNLKFRAGSQIRGVALFQVLPNQKIKVEFFPNQKASQVSGFTPKAQIYER